jgi:putative toxin-antitoxin system antitoxin component (TIGR02293 family)
MTVTIRYVKPAAGHGKRSITMKVKAAPRAITTGKPTAGSRSIFKAARKGILEATGVKVSFRALKPFLDYLHSPTTQVIEKVRMGFEVSLVGEYAKRIGIPKEDMFVLINLSRSTAHRMEQSNKVMDRLRSDAFAGAARVIEKARDMLGSDEAARNWLLTPVPALNFKTPQEWLDTSDGRQIVSSLLDQIQSGAYA